MYWYTTANMIAIGPDGILLNNDLVTGVICATRRARKEARMVVTAEMTKKDWQFRKGESGWRSAGQ